MSDLVNVIFEDADLLILNKPAGLVCHPTKNGEMSSLIGRLRLYLGGDAPAHLVNRLDRETSGVTVAAKNAATAGLLGKIWQSRSVRKEYLAIVHGTVLQDAGRLDLPLGKDEKSVVAIKDRVRSDGAAAVTEFFVERRFQRRADDFTLLRLVPLTGRKHQIRIHLAALGHPIVGDKLYGLNENHYLSFVQGSLSDAARQQLILPNHALHCRLVRFPWRCGEVEFEAPPDGAFAGFLAGV